MPNDNQKTGFSTTTVTDPDPAADNTSAPPVNNSVQEPSPDPFKTTADPLNETPLQTTSDTSVLNPVSPVGMVGSDSVTTPPSSGGSQDPVTTSAHVPQKYGGKKVIATIFGIFLLVGAVAAGVMLVGRIQELRELATGGTGNIAIFKTMCNQIGQQDTCNGRDTSLSNYKVDFQVHQGENDQGPVVQTITVTLSDNQNGQGNTGSGSQGRSVGGSLSQGTYTVCEIPIAYNATGDRVPLDVEPRPDKRETGHNRDDDDDDEDGKKNRDDDDDDNDSKKDDVDEDDDNDGINDDQDEDKKNQGSTGGTNQVEFGENCIKVRLNPGEAELKFLDKRQSPAATPTPAPTSTITPTKPPKATNTTTPSPSPTPTLPPQITAECFNVVVYNQDWQQLSANDLAGLKPGNIVRLTVGGQTSGGSFSKARFTVNGTSLGETTNKKPSSDSFYIEYTIPTGTSTFSIRGEIFHSSLGWI